MLIHKVGNKTFSYIHVPKNSGTFIRSCLKKKFEIVQNCWGLADKGKFDLAHVPFMLKDKYIKKPSAISKFYTFTRNPYQRSISAFFWKNKNINKQNAEPFKRFVREQLSTMQFSLDFPSELIHYYPQYIFLCNDNLSLAHEISFAKLEHMFPKVSQYDLSKFYDGDTIRVINEIYEIDFKYFGYEMINSIQFHSP